MNDLHKIIGFLRLSIKMKETYRFTPKSEGTFESDAEHSWNMALVCMMFGSRLQEELNQPINMERMLKMVLIHDLPEVLTGDTKTWDMQSRIGKEEKERASILQITADLPEDLRAEVLSLWEECEAKTTIEAKIVKSIDRLEPVLHRTLLGYGWENVKEDGEHSTVEALDSRQLPRHEFSQLITQLYIQIRDEAIENNMFPKDGNL